MKKFSNKNKNSGFTLMETVMAIFVFGLMTLGASLLLKNIVVNNRQQIMVMGNVDQARILANNFVQELRNATYGVNGAYPINQASSTQLIFFSTTPRNDGTISRIRYYVSGNTLYKGLTNPSGNPLNYNPATETVVPLNTQMSLGSNPLFYYYDGNYYGSGNALSNPVNINSIKYIKINLMVLKQLSATSNSTFTVSAGASIRNLKNNLGN